MNLYFVRSSDTPLAETNEVIMQPLSDEMRSLDNVRIVADPSQADFFILHEKYGYKDWRYINQLANDQLVGQKLYKTYTINCDTAATGLLRGLYTALPKNRLDAKIHDISPYTKLPNKYILETPHTQSQPKYLASWRGNLKSHKKLRGALIRCASNSENIHTETTDSWMNHNEKEMRSYVDLILNSQFSLCPAGWAPMSFRIYESMALGVPPVIIADQCVLPEGPDWDQCSIRIRESDVEKTESILSAQSAKSPDKGRKAREEWETYFSPSAVKKTYAHMLQRCISRSAAEDDSNESELKRMKSFQMAYSNRWTLPQRLKIKIEKLTN